MKLNAKALAAVRRQLWTIEKDARPKALRAAMRKAFAPVRDDARARAPHDTGELREALSLAWATGKSKSHGAVGLVARTTSTRSKQARMAAAVFGEAQTKAVPPSRRWHFAELGTATQRATPYIRPALDANAQKVIDALGREVDKAVKRAVKKGKR